MNRERSLLAFLDVISCALGAGVLIFLIHAAPPASTNATQQRLLVVCEQTEGVSRAIGILYREPGAAEWVSALDESCPFHFVSSGADGRAAVAVLVVDPAQVGEWAFRGYVVDYPNDQSNSGTGLSLRVHGIGPTDPTRLGHVRLPGDSTPILRVHVGL